MTEPTIGDVLVSRAALAKLVLDPYYYQEHEREEDELDASLCFGCNAPEHEPHLPDCPVPALAAALSAPALSGGDEATAREVHAAWRDGMLQQEREVAAHRMNWATLSSEDHELDAYIAQRVTAASLAEIKRLREVVGCVRDGLARHKNELLQGKREGSWTLGTCLITATDQLDDLLRGEATHR